MRTFTLYLFFLLIAALILSFAFMPRPRPPVTLIVSAGGAGAQSAVPLGRAIKEPEAVRRLTYNPWIMEPATTIRMEKPSYDLRDGMTF